MWPAAPTARPFRFAVRAMWRWRLKSTPDYPLRHLIAMFLKISFKTDAFLPEFACDPGAPVL
jgi:hypothetical protein